MRRLRLGTVGVLLALVLAVPGTASAGMGEVIDIIVGLTGPRMWGFPMDCEFNLQNRERACYLAGFRIPIDRTLNDTFLENRQFWAALGLTLMGSTGKDSPMRPFNKFDAGLVAFEPTLNVRSYRHVQSNFFLEHGGGGSILYVFGDGFTPFVKGGIKVRPVSATFRNINGSGFDLGLAYNLRFFPKAFTSAEFGVDGPSTHGGREVAHGYTITVGW